MNWKTYVEKQNARTFVLPSGWDSRDTVAEALGCSPERVDEHLRPGLKSGDIEKQVFRVWSREVKKVVPVIAYRSRSVAGAADPGSPAPASSSGSWTPEEHARAAQLRKAGKSLSQIATALGRTKSAVSNRLRTA